METSVFAMPTIPATIEERRALRPIGRNSERYQQFLAELRDIAILIDELGYDAFSTTEHHLHTEGGEAMPNSLLLYADLAARTRRLKFMPMSIVPAADDPIRIAEDIALVDQMTKGRLMVCFARGYQKRWIDILTQGRGATSLISESSDQRNREIFDEHLEVITKALTQDSWDHNGKHYQVPYPFDTGIEGYAGVNWTRQFGSDDEVDDQGVVRKIGVTPPPYQRPTPQFAVPFTASPSTLQNAARKGWLCIMYESQPEKFLGYLKDYQRIAGEHGHDLALGERCGATRSICIGDSYDEAFEKATKTAAFEFHHYFNYFGQGENFRLPSDPPDQPVQFKNEEEGAQRLIDFGHLICGTAREVKDQLVDLSRCHADGRLDWLIWQFYPQGTLPPEEQEKELRTFAEEIMPALKSERKQAAAR
jgi:alkanesulfonate monooxygenase SsuD/methylene tetrahydromethanopterin reductase-like flavin-dependent oxidoreductase (luciferase family)